MIVTSIDNSKELAKKIARRTNSRYIGADLMEFPDGDIYLKFKSEDFKGEKVVLVESFQPHSKDTLLNIIFAAKTLREFGAKKVILVAPYLGFMRQDKRFNKGECVSAPIMADIINNYVDKILTIDPHLHRIPKMKDIFSIPAKNLTANHVIAQYIKKKYKDVAVIGPDWESYQWADEISKEIGVEDTVMDKTRHSYRDVDVEMKKEIVLKGKNVVIVDDIISTGNTMIKACRSAKKLGAKSVNAIGVHGLFVEKGLPKMRRAGFDDIVTVNTIEHETNDIDIAPLLAEELKKELPKK